ncbi:hypothetical protein [Acetivibrio ethanolgignens]|uniref:Uncharacterized protein n=1 Tax=Acetivibrio ethanolgignens TaxID=290052 RepID=A0A0V8QEZ1_9FIRM|nr:hypothetical protein [Acetivibrio ethanolgignens]KSV59151.1 hypothetical protein ASU35_10360 [Acetivibrio ethanolgignens]
MSIRLSKEHGVNPTIPVCFWCGEGKNEIALLGKLKDDKKAPMYTVLDYEPCDKCKEMFKKGVLLVGVQYTSNGLPAIGKGDNNKPVYPTGTHAVVTKEWAAKAFSGTGAEVCGVNLLDDDVLQRMMSGKEENVV